MDSESSETLVNLLRSMLYLVKYYGPIEESAALRDVERSILAAIVELESANPPGVNPGESDSVADSDKEP